MRFAVYVTPSPQAALCRVAAGWLGRDAFDGRMLGHHDVAALSARRIAEITAEPRRYGFHATLKAPFRLAPGRRPEELHAALDAFCRARETFSIPALRIARIGPFFALVADGAAQSLQNLADAAVTDFEPFRAPLTADEIARRRPERLDERQRRHLDRWGYPYVFDDFLFHMTLAGPVHDDDAPAVAEALETVFSPVLSEPLAVDGVALFVEPEPGAPFQVDAWAGFGAEGVARGGVTPGEGMEARRQ